MESNERVEINSLHDLISDNNDYIQVENIVNNNNNINNNNYGNNNNVDVEGTQKVFVQTLNLQIKQLQELLVNKNKDFDSLNKENNKLKLVLIQEQKKLIDKDNILHSINVQKQNLEEKLKKNQTEMENMQKTIKDLNYKLIELNQNIISKENISQFSQKIKNEKLNQDNDRPGSQISVENEKYEIELKRLNTIKDEFEIKNNKLVFDNTALNNKINSIIHEHNNELNIYKSIYQNQINNLNKVISNLNNRISQLFAENNNKNNTKIYNNVLMKKEIMEKFNELENKLNNYDKENCFLRKENQKIKNELEELKLVVESKDTIIEKFKTDLANMENEFNNTNSKMDTIDKREYINQLLNEQKYLNKENKNLKNGLKQMTKNINEANALYSKKKEEHDKILQERDNKLKEYKKKIIVLKTKIKELHKEIDSLKQNKVSELKSSGSNKYYYSSKTYDAKNKNNKEIQKTVIYTPRVRKNSAPFDINIENKKEDNKSDIFRDIKRSEVPKEGNSIKPSILKGNKNIIKGEKEEKKENKNSNIITDIDKLANKELDLKIIKEYKDTLNQIDEQLKKLNS